MNKIGENAGLESNSSRPHNCMASLLYEKKLNLRMNVMYGQKP